MTFKTMEIIVRDPSSYELEILEEILEVNDHFRKENEELRERNRKLEEEVEARRGAHKTCAGILRQTRAREKELERTVHNLQTLVADLLDEARL